MGTRPSLRILSASSEQSGLLIEAGFFPNKEPEVHAISLASAEVPLFAQALSARPFGPDTEHSLFLESLTESGGQFCCSVRIASAGRRTVQKISICAATYEALRRVLNSNIVSEGYIGA
jgi:hypothetical protein